MPRPRGIITSCRIIRGALQPLLDEVEHFAMHDYALALAQGPRCRPDQRQAIAEKLHGYTGLPLDYI